MKSVYYNYQGNTYNMPPIVIANPYKHITIINLSDYDVYVFNEKTIVAFIPSQSAITLLDVFVNNRTYDTVDTALYVKTTPYPDNEVNIHIINYGA